MPGSESTSVTNVRLHPLAAECPPRKNFLTSYGASFNFIERSPGQVVASGGNNMECKNELMDDDLGSLSKDPNADSIIRSSWAWGKELEPDFDYEKISG